MESVIYFAIQSLIPYIGETVGLLTGFVMMLYFAISFYQFFSDVLTRSQK